MTDNTAPVADHYTRIKWRVHVVAWFIAKMEALSTKVAAFITAWSVVPWHTVALAALDEVTYVDGVIITVTEVVEAIDELVGALEVLSV